MRFSFCLRYVEIAFAFRTFNFSRSAARESSLSSTPVLSPKPTKCFWSLRCSTTQFMTVADEDRQKQQQRRRQTRQGRIYDRDSSRRQVLESPFPPRPQIKHTHRQHQQTSSSIPLSPPLSSPLPGQCAFWCGVREGGTRDKDGEGGKGGERRKGEIGRVVSVVRGVCV